MPMRAPSICLLLPGLLALLSACGGSSDPPPHLVVLLVDQLRADVARQHMPKTRALAERGVVFEQARSVAPWTYPSVVSMFSGLYPQEHGATGSLDGKKLTYFSPDVPLVQRTLTRAGYYSAGFVANPFVHEWNAFHEDFLHYDASFINSQGNDRGKGSEVWKSTMWGQHLNRALREHYDGRAPGRPEFTYVHYIDIHGLRKDRTRWEGAPFEGTLEAAAGFMDDRITELYDYFDARYDGNFVFVVTSDHGEELGDDEELGDGPLLRVKKASVYDFNLRIPLWILASDRVPQGRVVTEPVLNMDLAPTLLAWAGLPSPANTQGRSLLPAIEGGLTGPPRPLYARMDAFGRENDCVIWEDTKLLRHFDPRNHELRLERIYDLPRDPDEVRSDESRREVGGRSLEDLVTELAHASGRYAASYTKPGADVEENLSVLGYGVGQTPEQLPETLPTGGGDDAD